MDLEYAGLYGASGLLQLESHLGPVLVLALTQLCLVQRCICYLDELGPPETGLHLLNWVSSEHFCLSCTMFCFV